MGGINQKILDSVITQSLDLLRLDAGTRQQVLKLLMRLQQELVGRIANEDLTTFGKRRLAQFLKQASDVINRYYTMAQGELDLTLQHVGNIVATHAADTLSAAVTLDSALPPVGYFRSLVSNVLMQGAPIADWWARQSMDMGFRFANAMRQGLAQGETNQQLIYRLIGKRGSPGIMDIARNNAASLVQTSVQTVANDARLETFRRNADVIDSISWHTALDGHVCLLCIPRAELRWTIEGEPIGHDIPFENPPIHFNDRCVLIPVTKSFKDLGVDLPEPDTSTRSSSDGQISADTSFADFLDRKGADFQDEVLGPGRAQLWRDGTITLRQLLDLSGNPLTLAELRDKYA